MLKKEQLTVAPHFWAILPRKNIYTQKIITEGD